MTKDEIKAAVDAGKVVHWASDAYVVIKDSLGQYLIQCKSNGYCTGLHGREGGPYEDKLNGDPDEFYIEG